MAEPRQIPLGLVHPAEYGRDAFAVGASNRAALALVEKWPDWPQHVVLLSGPEGAGKTHLAHIWAAKSQAQIAGARNLQTIDPAGFLRGGAGVVEDIDQAGTDEQKVFHLINIGRELGGSLLLTSRRTAGGWPIELADLRSRLRLAAPAELAAPDEALLRQVMVKLFADRQLIVDRAVLDFLLPRIERSFSAATRIVAELDLEALASGRAITRPMAAAVLGRVHGALDESTDWQ